MKPRTSITPSQASKGLSTFTGAARDVLKSSTAQEGLANEAGIRAKKAKHSFRPEILKYLMAMIRLIAAYAKRRYRQVDVASLVTILAAVIYFVSPIDIIPDFIVGVGFIDDAAVLGLVLRKVRKELDAFMQWEKES